MTTNDTSIDAIAFTAEVLALVCELIHENGVTVGDNFFAAGGSSLAAAHFAAEIEQRYGVSLRLRTVFEAETIGELIDELYGLIGTDA